jgi:hypothetical protein
MRRFDSVLSMRSGLFSLVIESGAFEHGIRGRSHYVRNLS